MIFFFQDIATTGDGGSQAERFWEEVLPAV